MIERNLKLIQHEDGCIEAEFMTYPQYGIPHYVRRLLRLNEAEKAKAIIERGDIYEIDNFCYSIA